MVKLYNKAMMEETTLYNSASWLDMSLLDLSKLDLSQLDVSWLDLSQLDLSLLDLSQHGLSRVALSWLDRSQLSKQWFIFQNFFVRCLILVPKIKKKSIDCSLSYYWWLFKFPSILTQAAGGQEGQLLGVPRVHLSWLLLPRRCNARG